MKKRIVSLILVVAMCLLTLCSCSGGLAGKKMSKYASFDYATFAAKLQELEIEDGDFGTVEADRQNKVIDTIFAALAANAAEGEQLTAGAPGKYDSFYYCYYITATIDGKEYTFNTANMNGAKPGSVQLGISTLEGVDKLIEENVLGVELDGKTYSTLASGTLKAEDFVYISYTKTYSVPAVDENGNPVLNEDGNQKVDTVTLTAAYELVQLPKVVPTTPDNGEGTEGEGTENGGTSTAAEENSGELESIPFLQSLIADKVGKVSDHKCKEVIDGVEREVTYSGITVHWIVENKGSEITFKDITYTSDNKVADVYSSGPEADNGKINLKGVELTYHILPVYFIDVADELNAGVIVEFLLGNDKDSDGSIEDSEKGSLEIFTSEDEKYKTGDKTLKVIIEELSDAYGNLAKAKKDLADAEATLDKTADDADAKEKKEEAERNILIWSAKATDTVASINSDAANDIKAKYTESVYNNLEKAYENELITNLSKEVIALAKEYITYTGKLPKGEVKDAYKRIENLHKYNFYEGKVSGSTKTNYEAYEGVYENYLKKALELKTTATKAECKAAMQAQAEKYVKDMILIYTLAEQYGDEVKVGKDEIKEFNNSYYAVLMGVDEADFVAGETLNNVIYHILEVEEQPEGEENNDENNVVEFVRVEYTIKAETTEDDTTDGEGSDNGEGESNS